MYLCSQNSLKKSNIHILKNRKIEVDAVAPTFLQ